MHEAGFTEEIVKNILSEVQKHPDRDFRSARVLVGEVFHLNSEAVIMHYKLLTQGSGLKGLSLQLEEVPIVIECNDCKKKGGVEDHHLLMCTFCDSQNVTTLDGDKIEIELRS